MVSGVRYEITWKGGHKALQPRRLAYQELKKRLAPENMPLQFVPNLGDEAYMTLTGVLQVGRGDRAVLFNLMYFQDSPSKFWWMQHSRASNDRSGRAKKARMNVLGEA